VLAFVISVPNSQHFAGHSSVFVHQFVLGVVPRAGVVITFCPLSRAAVSHFLVRYVL
jgi:hypothetical protein